MLDTKEHKKKAKKKAKKMAKKKKVNTSMADFLKCDAKSCDAVAILDIRIAKGFDL